MAYEPLHHKYRPQTFGALVGQDAIATTLSSALRQRRIAPAYLFCGPRGTGKTSSARILAKSLNCIAQDHPTPEPCGTCETCRSITNGSALDFIEIDAASNTGVDNIRELIERAQFAPVQCRYKVYVIDECLTGDCLVLTQDGLSRIDDPSIEGKRVLSYNEQTKAWEYKQALRWLNQGTRDILAIQTTHRKIKCTKNHLIRTDQGWVAAGDLKNGMKILSPVPVAAAPSSFNLAPMDDPGATLGAISSKATPTAKSPTALSVSLSRLSHCARFVSAAAEKSSLSQSSCNKREGALEASRATGKNIRTKSSTATGPLEPNTLSANLTPSLPKPWVSSTALSWETDRLPTPINTVDFPAWPGLMEISSKPGWSTKPQGWLACSQESTLQPTQGTASAQSVATPPVTPILSTSLSRSKTGLEERASRQAGSHKFPLKGLPGGTWTTAPSASALRVALKFNSIPKAIPAQKTTSLLNGLPAWATQQRSDSTPEVIAVIDTTTLPWEQRQPAIYWPTSDHSPSLQWTINLETVVSVNPGGTEPVYDIEVEDNHNFVANGLLVHNCHMLSTAAFNALLKTLEEPPSNVVFILATTDPQRVLPTIISRCQRFDYRRIPLEPMIGHLRKIADQEEIAINDEALRLVAQVSQGGLRDAQSLLDQLSLLEPPIAADAVWDLVGAVPERDLLTLVQGILSDDSTMVLDQARKLMDRGREPLIVLQNLAGFYRDLLIAKTAGDRPDLVAITPQTWADMQTLVQSLDAKLFLLGQQHLRSAEGQVKNTTQPRLWLEVTLLGLLPSTLAGLAGGAGSAMAPGPARSLGAITPVIAPVIAPQAPATVSPPPQPSPEPPTPTDLAPPPTASDQGEPPSVVPPPLAAVPPLPSPTDQPTVPPAADDHLPDLNDLWIRIIAVLEPLGTRALMQQQGSLLFFDGVVARVGISSRPLFKMAQGRVDNVEAAFIKVLGHKVQVSLEVLPDPKPEAPAPNISQATGQNPNDRPAPLEPATSTAPPAASPPKPPTTAAATAIAAATPEPAEPQALPAIASDFDRAVKNFAQFFNGQVVELDDDLGLSSEPLKPSKAAAQQPSHPDKDVPF